MIKIIRKKVNYLYKSQKKIMEKYKQEKNAKGATSLILNYSSLEDDSFKKIIKWLVSEERLTIEFANQCKKEFLMLTAIGINPKNPLFKKTIIVPSLNADNFFHAFLLFNYEYNKWCENVCGSILYHYPRRTTKTGWTLTQNAVKRHFGELWEQPGTSGMGQACIDMEYGKW